MKSKLLVAAGTTLAVGALTIAVPVLAQTDDAAATNTQSVEQQEGRFGKFREKMHERMEDREPLTFEEAQTKMTEHLTNATDRTQQQLDDLYSGELETRLKNRLESSSSYLEKVQSATSEDDLKEIRETMRAEIEALIESGELPEGMGKRMHHFKGKGKFGPQTDETADNA